MFLLPFDTVGSAKIETRKGLLRPFMLSALEASFARRGFNAARLQQRLHLEAIGETFIQGYNAGLLARDIPSVFTAIAHRPAFFRGFYAEGGAMGVCVRDALSFRRPLLPELLGKCSGDYIYLAHVGCGWAMARLPWRRSKIMNSLDTLLVPLAFDGWGFHDCYFNPGKLPRGAGRAVIRAGGEAAGRAWDQGAGRALWFVSGGDVDRAFGLIADINHARHPDILAGLGLAMTYAGGAGTGELAMARNLAGTNGRDLAQGSAFALEAHVLAGTGGQAAYDRAAALTGVPSEKICEIVRQALPIPLGSRSGVSDSSWTLYQRWRAAVADTLSKARERVS